MIRKLRRKMMLLVTAVLILVSAGIVLSINIINWNNLESQAESVLKILAENNGLRPENLDDILESQEDSGQDVTSDSAGQELQTNSEAEIDEVVLTNLSYTEIGQENPETGVYEEFSRSQEQMNDSLEQKEQTPEGQMQQPAEENAQLPAAMTETVPPAQDAEAGQASSETSQNSAAADGTEEIRVPEETEAEKSTGETTENAILDKKPKEKRTVVGQPIETETSKASLANYYVVYLTEDGQIEGWNSDRADLYSDDQIRDLTTYALAQGEESGHVGTQFYLFTEQDGQRMLIVLDARLEVASAKSVLLTTIMIAAIACLLLSGAAYLLIRKMVRPVQEAFDKQKQFVLDASHELKTPLAVITANADVLEMDIGENEFLGYIRSEAKRTNLLVENLLTMARMDQGTICADLHPMDLGKAVLSVSLPFESKAFEDGKQFDIQVAEDVFCQGDEAMIKQLTVLLLSNAFKYSDENGSIMVEVQRKGNGAELCVSNSGPGILPKDREKIFERFYRADPSRNKSIPGFGFGLSIAKKIVEMHKGKIRAFSEPDKRTEFRVFLPG